MSKNMNKKKQDARRALQFAWRRVIGGRNRPSVKDSLAGLKGHLKVDGTEVKVALAAHRAGLVSSKNMRSVINGASTGSPRLPAPKRSVESAANRARNGDFYKSWAWTALRMKVLKVYGRRCQCCGASPENGAVIQDDHIKPRSKFPELELEFDNLQVLCQECNRGKSNVLTDDFRPGAFERELERWQAAVRELEVVGP